MALELLKVHPDIIVNVANIAYVELTGKGGADIYFAGNAKPLHLNTTEAETLRNYISGVQETDTSEAA
jgi:hypothetical protein